MHGVSSAFINFPACCHITEADEGRTVQKLVSIEVHLCNEMLNQSQRSRTDTCSQTKRILQARWDLYSLRYVV